MEMSINITSSPKTRKKREKNGVLEKNGVRSCILHVKKRGLVFCMGMFRFQTDCAKFKT